MMAMRTRSSTKTRIEFGDFQTPSDLATKVCSLIAARGLTPASVVEPTCGTGNFLFAALDRFPTVQRALALDINPTHIQAVKDRLSKISYSTRVDVIRDSFFAADWPRLLRDLPDPILLVGNPPWVTSAKLGSLESSNLPEKRNFQQRRGLDARTGKANFDISEWMLIHLLQWLSGRNATLAMLCKTAVARKALVHGWKCEAGPTKADIYSIDAPRYFGAAVDACLLVCQLGPTRTTYVCSVYPSVDKHERPAFIGFRDGMLVADLDMYDRWKHLAGRETHRWRSGIKHDCSRILELRREGNRYCNGLGELIDLEPEYLYPMLKGSDIANGKVQIPRSWMLVTQRFIGEDTNKIADSAPKTWSYLVKHQDLLDKRASSIYRSRPKFSIFGVGGYSFAPWKVAVSALYKKLHFAVVGQFEAKPVVLDDTSYFISAESREEAECLAKLLNSEAAQSFYRAFVFWDSKRPITVDTLCRLDLLAVARSLGSEEIVRSYLHRQATFVQSN